MQNTGTITESPLATILETVQKDRATGTLQLRAGDRQATLYFLFGHLFHAVDGDRQGEDVVHDALGWAAGDYTFDTKAKLPAEESIKVSTAELLASHGGKSGTGSTDEADPPASDPADSEEAAE
ncbi:MAG: DUF4388 domain-containing protein, partial [Candidatus Dormibacteria bacterium]